MQERELPPVKESLLENRTVVMKFGGSSVATADRLLHAAMIVKDHAQKAPVVVIVSAMQGVTDRLYAIYDALSQGDAAKVKDDLGFLEALHRDAARVVTGNNGGYAAIDRAINQFRQDVSRYAVADCLAPADKDALVSYGERLSPLLLSAALKYCGKEAQAVDAGTIITTDGHFGNAMVNLAESRAKTHKTVLPLLKVNTTPIIGGFYGVSAQGEISILGRGGSDYTAAAVAHVLNARELILWKEVDGVYSTDPKANENAQFFSQLTYEEAYALASNGAKIIHPGAIRPVAELQIPLYVRNTFRPENPGTRIS